MKLLKPGLPMLRSGMAMLKHTDAHGAPVERLRGSSLDAVRKRLLARSGSLCECPMCAAGYPLKLTWKTSEVDHIVPLFDGGTNAFSNLRILHKDCHKAITLGQQEAMRGRTWADKVDVE